MPGEWLFALACGIAALLYGALAARWILARPTGSERMQALAAAGRLDDGFRLLEVRGGAHHCAAYSPSLSAPRIRLI